MKGKYLVTIQNRQVYYKFELERNISIIKGDSATGKTTLIDMIRSYADNGAQSGVELTCKKKCCVLEGSNWKILLDNTHDSIVFIDEGNRFIVTPEFASAIKGSDNYYVIVTRESLYNLPHSVDCIYTIRNSGKYGELKKTYNSFHRLYGEHSFQQFQDFDVDAILTEDQNSGYQFFQKIASNNDIKCLSAKGKSNILKKLKSIQNNRVFIVADGAAFGPEMEGILDYQRFHPDQVVIFLPESFEWLILKADILHNNDVKEILDDPASHIESSEYFSWEQYFTSLLIEETRDSVMAYNKRELASFYLQERIVSKIEDTMKSLT